MNTSGSFSLKRTWKNTSGSDTYDEITTKRLKSDYVSGISQDHFNLSNPIIGPPNTELDGNEKPGQLRFKYYTEVQKGLLQVYDGSEWVSLNELEDSSLWHLSDNVVNIKNNYKLNLTNDLIVKDIRIPSAMTFYANTPTNAIINYGYYDSELGHYVSTASIDLYNGLISANLQCNEIDLKPTTYTGESIINFYSKRNGVFTNPVYLTTEYNQDFPMYPFLSIYRNLSSSYSNKVFDINAYDQVTFYKKVYFRDSFTDLSSSRYKNSINKIDDISDEILNLEAKTYIMNFDKRNEVKLGLIVEDIYLKCPKIRDFVCDYQNIKLIDKNYRKDIDDQFTFTKNNEKYVVEGIRYNAIIVLLIEQLKKQKSEINNLKEQLSIISNKVQELINTVNNLLQNQ